MLEVYEKKSNSLSFNFKRFDDDPEDPQTEAESSSKVPIVAGVIAVVILLTGLVIAKWFYNRRRKNERCVYVEVWLKYSKCILLNRRYFLIGLHQWNSTEMEMVECELVLQGLNFQILNTRIQKHSVLVFATALITKVRVLCRAVQCNVMLC